MKVLFELFRKLEQEGWSGEVAVTSSQGNATVLIKDGALLWTHRPLDRAIEKFEKIEWLVLPPPEALNSYQSWEDLIRAILKLNTKNYTRLIQFLKRDRLELFFRIFFWSNVDLHPRAYSVEAPDPSELGFYSPRQIASLLNEAEKRMVEWPKIQERIGNSKRVFVSQVSNLANLLENQAPLDAVDESLNHFEATRKLSPKSSAFTIEELEIIRLCDGGNSVQDIIRLCPDGEFLTLRRLSELWKKGALRPKDDDEPIMGLNERPSEFAVRDFVSAAAIIALTAFLFFIADRVIEFNENASTQSVPQELYQSLDLYRLKEGNYPLTLADLEKNGFLTHEILHNFQYTLQDPHQYDLH